MGDDPHAPAEGVARPQGPVQVSQVDEIDDAIGLVAGIHLPTHHHARFRWVHVVAIAIGHHPALGPGRDEAHGAHPEVVLAEHTVHGLVVAEQRLLVVGRHQTGVGIGQTLHAWGDLAQREQRRREHAGQQGRLEA